MLYRFGGVLLGITNEDNLIVEPIRGERFFAYPEGGEWICFTIRSLENEIRYLVLHLGSEVQIPKTTPSTLHLGQEYVFELRKLENYEEFAIPNLFTVSHEGEKPLLKPIFFMLETVRYAGRG